MAAIAQSYLTHTGKIGITDGNDNGTYSLSFEVTHANVNINTKYSSHIFLEVNRVEYELFINKEFQRINQSKVFTIPGVPNQDLMND